MAGGSCILDVLQPGAVALSAADRSSVHQLQNMTLTWEDALLGVCFREQR